MSNRTNGVPEGAIAIVGMAARVPGAETLDEFWRLLREGRDATTHLSDDALAAAGVDADMARRPDYVRIRPTLPRVEEFDAAFFRISPREAELMDPQHRLLLECAWEAMEDAAYDSHAYSGRVGVFATAGKNTYLVRHLLDGRDWTHSEEVFQLLLGNEKDYLSSRISYKLDLKGPSLTIQTACSSSLVAVHLACQSLLLAECDMAIVGAACIDPPSAGYLAHPGGILSTDGHCRTFDAGANGTTFGQGVCAVVLRKAEQAAADRDHVRAFIRATAVNNDGADRAAFTAPSVHGQADVIREAIAVAGVQADTISYVEAHGTATALGDPIEVQALTAAFGTTLERESCALGSVKTNIGHLGPAAGLAGLIKTVLALEHRELPPTVHFRTPNPLLGLEASPFYVNAQHRRWDAEAPRRAAVSSFGQGGTNAHAVLEEAPEYAAHPATGRSHVLTLSAHTPAALDAMSARLADFLEETAFDLADIAYSLQIGRRAFAVRRAVVASDRAEAARALRAGAPGQVFDGVLTERAGHGDTSGARADAGVRDAFALARRWVRGAPCDWPAHHEPEERRRVPLPTYPFERRRYWIDVVPDVGSSRTERASPAMSDRAASAPDTVEAEVVAIFRAILGEQGLGAEDDFFACGGDSLMEVQVRARVQASLGVSLARGALLQHPTAAELSRFIGGTRPSTPLRDDGARARADVALDPAIAATGRTRIERAGDKRVFLTGATGLVGSHLLNEILRTTDAQVMCLVRAATAAEAVARVMRTAAFYKLDTAAFAPRIAAVPGNLAQPRFGLAQADFDGLADRIDEIFHCGAAVNFLQPYGALKRCNVDGTVEVLRLAAAGPATPVHYCSSIAVFESDSFAGVRRVAESVDLAGSVGFHNGYSLSKWVAECIALLARERGIPVSVYRLTNIAGHTRTGIVSPHHIVAALIKSCVELGLAPGDHTLNVLPVDAACRIVLALASRPPAADRVFHVVHPSSTRLDDVARWLADRGYDVRPCGYDEWLGALRLASDDNAMKVFLPLLDVAPLFSGRQYDVDRVRACVPDLDSFCPPVADVLLDRLIEPLVASGWLPAPPLAQHIAAS